MSTPKFPASFKPVEEKENDFPSSFKPVNQETPASLKRTAQAYGTGITGGIPGVIGDIKNFISQTGLGGVLGGQVLDEIPLKGTEELTQKSQEANDFTPSNSLERIAQKGGEFGGQGALIGTAIGGPIGGIVGTGVGSASGFLYEGLKELGVPDTVALLVSALTPSGASGISKLAGKGKAVPKVGKSPPPPPPREPPPPLFPKTEIERLPSGLSKTKVLEENPLSKFATITKERQKSAIRTLDQEASQLARKSVEKHLPLSQQIEEGFDFQENLRGKFGRLKNLAEKSKVQVDVTPLSELLSKTSSEIRGIPRPSPDIVKIKSEIDALRNNPQTSLKNLLRIYRDNNKKQRAIRERALLTGSQKEYSDFLAEMNRSIYDSFKRTLPEDSLWLKSFKKYNDSYKEFQNTRNALKLLDPFLRGEITPGKLARIAQDEPTQKRLQFSMGKEGASEVIQLARDLKSSRIAIKKIPIQRLKAFDDIYPIGLLIPFIKIPVAIVKGTQMARNAMGYYLTTPSRTKMADKAVKALNHNDIEAYKKATQELKPPVSD